MRLLLDTHVLLWLWLEPERLRQDVIDAVTDASNDVLLSVASAWEIAIKSELGKLATSAIRVLPIEIDHALRVRCPPITAIRSTACSSRRPSSSGCNS